MALPLGYSKEELEKIRDFFADRSEYETEFRFVTLLGFYGKVEDFRSITNDELKVYNVFKEEYGDKFPELLRKEGKTEIEHMCHFVSQYRADKLRRWINKNVERINATKQEA